MRRMYTGGPNTSHNIAFCFADVKRAVTTEEYQREVVCIVRNLALSSECTVEEVMQLVEELVTKEDRGDLAEEVMTLLSILKIYQLPFPQCFTFLEPSTSTKIISKYNIRRERSDHFQCLLLIDPFQRAIPQVVTMLLEQMPWQDYYKDKLEVLLPIILQRRPDEAQTLLLELLEKVQI